uniref:Bacterial phospholipase C C-terminal domain-containing protein n=1 Tax=Paramoeba aestuarina TaxID=180227 RepID=A0A7S4PFL7_9EUKA
MGRACVLFSVLVLVVWPGDAEGSSLDDVHHIVMFMQENRPLDHYMGVLAGVRGFNDRTTVPLRSGLNAFYQPTNQSDLSEYMLPYHADSNKTSAMCMHAPEMYYTTDLGIYNQGRMDSWNTARDAGMGMSYFTRDDLPYYYTLWDNFAIGDQYFQSVFSATNPNRMMSFSGSNGGSVGEQPVVTNYEPQPGFNWSTVAEVMENNNISWKVYQQRDNFDDNAFAWFNNFQQAKPGSPLYDKGMIRYLNLTAEFQKDVENDKLPQVSWIIAPTARSEHATNHPCAGEDFTARLLKVLQQNPDVYANTAFILNYDEGGQFYDHVWCPTPPVDEKEGISTVSVEGEINYDNLVTEPSPYGLGFRVPIVVVSPWTRGKLLYSQVMDHTSVLFLLESKFNVTIDTISAWRRALCGNLLGIFDFDNPDYSWPDLPDTSDYVNQGNYECDTLPPVEIPSEQSMPVQEPGTRLSKALPYTFLVTQTREDDVLKIKIDNAGDLGGAFILFDVLHLKDVRPRLYTIEAGKTIIDVIPLRYEDKLENYTLVLQGPNGFVRYMSGPLDKSDACGGNVEAYITYNERLNDVIVNTINNQDASVTVELVDNAYGHSSQPDWEVYDVPPNGGTDSRKINVQSSGNWYDLSVIIHNEDCFERRFMGRMEVGTAGMSDPAMSEVFVIIHINSS